MSARTSISVVARIHEYITNDLGTASQQHVLEFPGSLNLSGEYATGVGDNQFDAVWSDSNSLASTTVSYDLVGSLTEAVGGATISAAELCGIPIRNRATAAASVITVGNGTNPAFSGLFGGATQTAIVPASGCFFWFAPLDGGGVALTGGSADVLKLSTGATVPYDIVLWFRKT